MSWGDKGWSDGSGLKWHAYWHAKERKMHFQVCVEAENLGLAITMAREKLNAMFGCEIAPTALFDIIPAHRGRK